MIVVKPEVSESTSGRSGAKAIVQPNSSYDPSNVFILELATVLVTKDNQVMAESGQAVADRLLDTIRGSSNTHPLTLSRAVLYLLHLMRVGAAHSFVRAPVILHTISGFDPNTIQATAIAVVRGLSACVSVPGPLRSEIANIPDFWSIMQSNVTVGEAAPSIFNVLVSLITDQPPAITADNYESAVTLLNSFATMGKIGALTEQKQDPNLRLQKPVKVMKPKENEVVDRAYHALSLIYQMTSRAPRLIQQSHLQRQEAWITYWSPIFKALRAQSLNPCRKIRHQALSCLQRSLLSPDLASEDHQEWTAIFSEVLFPLLSRLLKPEVWQTDVTGMSETRVQAATILCKVFLHYLVLLSDWDGMLDLWIKILDILDRLMSSGQSDGLEEAIPESLKNILLVMVDGGYLKPPQGNEKPSAMWEQTRSRVERIMPDLLEGLLESAKQDFGGSTAVKGTTISDSSDTVQRQEQSATIREPANGIH